MYFLRLGFFDSFEQAESVKERLLAHYPLAWATEVSEAEHERAIGAPAKAAPVPPSAPRATPAKPRADIAYALNLASSPSAALPVKPLPAPYDGYRLYRTETRQKGKIWHRLRLGFFPTRAEAEKARRALKSLYPDVWIAVADAKEQAVAGERPVQPTAPARRPAAEPAPSTDEVGKLMAEGRAALGAGRPVDAIRIFTRVLAVPGHPRAPEALELLGLARERNKQPDLARVEYKLYLKLYPEGEGADRVRQRLANLEPGAAVKLREPKRREEKRRTELFGTFSQQYYRGNSKVDTTLKTGPTIGEEETLTFTDESTLVNVIDVNARMRDERYDNRAVLSAHYNYDRLEHEDDSRVANAYGEVKDRQLGYAVRLGRQPSTSGVLTRFDGGLFSYHFTPRIGVNLVAGEPVDKIARDSDRSFYAFSVDLGSESGALGTNLYYFKQEIDGLTDREAVGTEVRYFSNGSSVFALVDYETSYKELNILLLQGNWTSEGGTTYNLLYDYRRVPPLQASNALIGETTESIDTLLETRTEEQIRADARDRTDTAKVVSGGFLHPLTERLQAGLDVTATKQLGTPASGTQPASPGTGTAWTYAGKLIGTGLFAKSAITVFGVAHTDSDAFDADSFALTHRVPFGRWRADLSVRYYTEDRADDVSRNRLTPALKLDYFWRENVALEFEYSQERQETTGPLQDEDSVRDFFIVGYRWDF